MDENSKLLVQNISIYSKFESTMKKHFKIGKIFYQNPNNLKNKM